MLNITKMDTKSYQIALTFDLGDLLFGSLDDEVSVSWSVRINCIELNFSARFGLQSLDRIATSSDDNPHIFLAYCEVRSSLEGSLVLIEVTTSAALSTVVISVVILRNDMFTFFPF